MSGGRGGELPRNFAELVHSAGSVYTSDLLFEITDQFSSWLPSTIFNSLDSSQVRLNLGTFKNN